MRDRDKYISDTRDGQGHSTNPSDPQPSLSPQEVAPKLVSDRDASSPTQTMESSSFLGRRVLALDAGGLFIERHTVSSQISAIFQRRADPTGYDWHHVSPITREFYFSEFQKKFTWDPIIHDAIRSAWDALATRRYSEMLHRWRKFGHRPVHVPEEIWHEWHQVWQLEAWVNARSEQVGEPMDELLSQASHADSTDGETSVQLSPRESRRMFLEDVGAQPHDHRVYGLGTKASKFFSVPCSCSCHARSGDILAEHIAEMKRSILDEVRQDINEGTSKYWQQLDDLKAQLKHTSELHQHLIAQHAADQQQIRELQELIRVMSQNTKSLLSDTSQPLPHDPPQDD